MADSKDSIYFSDHFSVDPSALERYGAFNISLLADLPLFIDPFLLFNSPKPAYQKLHEDIIRYLVFLRDRAADPALHPDLLSAWFLFSEVKQTWFGYTKSGNGGSGLGWDFARALHRNLGAIFHDFGKETIARGTHLEKLCLIRSGVGRDNISDFTTNLIKEFLLDYTQRFTLKHVPVGQRREFPIQKVRFDYETESWVTSRFVLPVLTGAKGRTDFVVLTPKDMLTKDETWINRPDLFHDFETVADSIPNDALRGQVNNYFRQRLSKKPSKQEIDDAISATTAKFPEILDYYIKYKEDSGESAVSVSKEKVRESQHLYVGNVRSLADLLRTLSNFYQLEGTTYEEAKERVLFLKDVVENKGGHKLFYVGSQPIQRESDLHILYRLTWYNTPSDVTREANDGRGPVDFKVSRGSKDKTLVEFKLATNTHLERNLEKQAEIYQRASDAKRTLKVIFCFSEADEKRVAGILQKLKLAGSEDIVLIDARRDNKPSGSKA